jgi:hypothetical protein
MNRPEFGSKRSLFGRIVKPKRDRVGTKTTPAERPVFLAVSVNSRYNPTRGITIEVLADERSVVEWKRDQGHHAEIYIRAVHPDTIRPWYRDEQAGES